MKNIFFKVNFNTFIRQKKKTLTLFQIDSAEDNENDDIWSVTYNRKWAKNVVNVSKVHKDNQSA